MAEIADTAATAFAVEQRVRDRLHGDEGKILDVRTRDDGGVVCKVWFGGARGDLRYLTAARLEPVEAPVRAPAWVG